jgi:hypothetical protein
LEWANTDFLFRGEKMGNNTHTIEINAVLKTTLGNVDSTIKEL